MTTQEGIRTVNASTLHAHVHVLYIQLSIKHYVAEGVNKIKNCKSFPFIEKA